MKSITWLPQQNNFIQGSLGDNKFYIKLTNPKLPTYNSEEPVNSYYITNPINTRKFLPETKEELTISGAKAKLLQIISETHDLCSVPKGNNKEKSS